MPLPNIAIPPVADIPRAPGVPPLRQITRALNTVALVAASAIKFLRAFQGPQWGVFDEGGQPFLIGDSVVGVALKKDYRVSNFPIEEGEFRSYNKVELPFDARLGFTVGGADSDRAAFLAKVKGAAGTTRTFTVVMPEITYPRATIARYDFERRARGGAFLLLVDVWLEEVRRPVSRPPAAGEAPSITSGQNPASASPQSIGSVQPTAPSPTQASAAEASAAEASA